MYILDGLENSKRHEDEVEPHTSPKPCDVLLLSHAASSAKMQNLKTYMRIDLTLYICEWLAMETRNDMYIGGRLRELDKTINQMRSCARWADKEYEFDQIHKKTQRFILADVVSLLGFDTTCTPLEGMTVCRTVESTMLPADGFDSTLEKQV